MRGGTGRKSWGKMTAAIANELEISDGETDYIRNEGYL